MTVHWLDLIAVAAGLAAVCGVAAVVAGTVAVLRFAARPRAPGVLQPPVTVLRPLCGDEPLLEDALASMCRQDYPVFQLVLGVQDAADPALPTARRVRARFPALAIAIVVDPAVHGPNRKISNLMNMMRAAEHDVLVFADSDLHVGPDYLQRIAAALERPGVGLVTTMSRGLPTVAGLAARLGATGISHSFLPGVLLSRALGRSDCLGTTMALRRDTLAETGGLAGLVGHLADDNILSQRVLGLGLGVSLADSVPMVAVAEMSFAALWQHELRWARTNRTIERWLFAASAVQFPLFWAAAAVLLSGAAGWACGLFAAAWAVRAAAPVIVDGALQEPRQPFVPPTPLMLPARDVLSVVLIAASYCGSRVVWRGRVMRAAALPSAKRRQPAILGHAPEERRPDLGAAEQGDADVAAHA